MKHNYSAKYKNIILKQINENDIENLRNWRNDSTLSRYLRPVGHISKESQLAWYHEYLDDDSVIFFGARDALKDKMFGTVALYDFSEGAAEIGKIVIGDNEYRGKHLAYDMFLMAMKIGVDYLGINKYILEVHEDNQAAGKTYSRLGFEKYGSHTTYDGKQAIDMELYKEKLFEINPQIVDIVIENN